MEHRRRPRDDEDAERGAEIESAVDPQDLRRGGRLHDSRNERRADAAPGCGWKDPLRLAATGISERVTERTRSDRDVCKAPILDVEHRSRLSRHRGRAHVPPAQTLQTPGDS